MSKIIKMDAAMSEATSKFATAIKKGEAESGRKFADAGDALVDSWLTKYG